MSETFALVLSNSGDATADYLCERLTHAGVTHRRFNTDTALEAVRLRMVDGDFYLAWDGFTMHPHQIHAVVYRRPKPFAAPVAGDVYQQNHASDEWAEAVEGFLAHVPTERWLNHPSRNFNASHKVEQLTRARECGLSVPAWIVTTIPEDARKFLDEHGPQVIAKPLASGYIERATPLEDTLIYTRSIDSSHAPLFDRLSACPVLFQSCVRKQVDVRLIVVDHRMTAVSLVGKEPDGSQRLDIRRDNMRDVAYAPLAIPRHIQRGIADLMAGYGLRFAAIDFAIDFDGQWVFFEVNPNGQWAWLDLAGASDVGELFIDALQESEET